MGFNSAFKGLKDEVSAVQLDVSICRRILVIIRSGAILCAKPRFDEDITTKNTNARKFQYKIKFFT